MMWTDGFLRLFPPWEMYFFGHTVPASFSIMVLMPLIFVLLISYPWIEKRLNKDRARHNLLQRPRDVPVRTAIGAMALTFYLMLTLACVNDIIALRFNISLNATTWAFRIALLLAPPLAYLFAYRVCLALQRSDREVLEHGIETGIIRRLTHGEYIEIHQPLGPVDEHGHPIPLEYQGARCAEEDEQAGSGGQAGSRARSCGPTPPPRAAELTAIEHAEHHKQLEILAEYQDQAAGEGGKHEH